MPKILIKSLKPVHKADNIYPVANILDLTLHLVYMKVGKKTSSYRFSLSWLLCIPSSCYGWKTVPTLGFSPTGFYHTPSFSSWCSQTSISRLIGSPQVLRKTAVHRMANRTTIVMANTSIIDECPHPFSVTNPLFFHPGQIYILFSVPQ